MASARETIDSQPQLPDQQEAETSQTTFALEGMTCAACAMRIEKGLRKVPGVLDAQVNLASERGTVTYNPTLTGIEQMQQKVEAIGYKATPLDLPAPQPASAPADGEASVQQEFTQSNSQEDEISQRKAAEIVRKR